MLSHSELAVLAARSYCGPQSGHVALDVRYDLIPREGEVIVVMPGTHPADALDWLRDLRAWPAVVGPMARCIPASARARRPCGRSWSVTCRPTA